MTAYLRFTHERRAKVVSAAPERKEGPVEKSAL